MYRRQFLSNTGKIAGISAYASVLSLWSSLTRAYQTLEEKQSFDFNYVKKLAQNLAQHPFVEYKPPVPSSIDQLTWEQYQSIKFNPDHMLWGKDNLLVSANFFHLGLFFKKPVKMYQVIDGQAQEIVYNPAMFGHESSGLDTQTISQNLGFAGFKLFSADDMTKDIAAFLGASYFRAVGSEKQYGLSARGLAVNTGMPYPEEFPEFTSFWLVKPKPNATFVTIYALLDSPSIAGAYQFDISPQDTLTMDVSAFLYPRKEIERLGIGTCTSMYQYGENDKHMAWDWRPEIHDSDGLQIHTGDGEWIWRPLTNPQTLRFNAFIDHNPHGFGLVQRDRNFDHYQDDGVFYNRRPSLWVEPKGQWSEGAIDLIEIPTIDETFDNIVAFWTPKQKPQPAHEYHYDYRLYWGSRPPTQTPLALCVDTYTGLGGVIGQKRTYYSQRFTVDFAGESLTKLIENDQVQAIVSATRGKIELVSARPLHEKKGYRAMFDIVPDASTEQIDIRLYLRSGNQTLTETWLYQWTPPALDARKLY